MSPELFVFLSAWEILPTKPWAWSQALFWVWSQALGMRACPTDLHHQAQGMSPTSPPCPCPRPYHPALGISPARTKHPDSAEIC